jgi:hypothetical protein
MLMYSDVAPVGDFNSLRGILQNHQWVHKNEKDLDLIKGKWLYILVWSVSNCFFCFFGTFRSSET